MERRDLLKKMAVGGAAVGAASLVTSTPAFAFTDPIPNTTPTLVVDVQDVGLLVGVELNLSMNAEIPECPESSRAFGGSTIAATSFTTTERVEAFPPIPASGFAQGPAVFSLFIWRIITNQSSVTFNLRARTRCTYETGTSQGCIGWDITFTADAFVGWDPTPTIDINLGSARRERSSPIAGMVGTPRSNRPPTRHPTSTFPRRHDLSVTRTAPE